MNGNYTYVLPSNHPTLSGGRCYYPFFTDEKIESQKGKMTCLMSHSGQRQHSNISLIPESFLLNIIPLNKVVIFPSKQLLLELTFIILKRDKEKAVVTGH